MGPNRSLDVARLRLVPVRQAGAQTAGIQLPSHSTSPGLLGTRATA